MVNVTLLVAFAQFLLYFAPKIYSAAFTFIGFLFDLTRFLNLLLDSSQMSSFKRGTISHPSS